MTLTLYILVCDSACTVHRSSYVSQISSLITHFSHLPTVKQISRPCSSMNHLPWPGNSSFMANYIRSCVRNHFLTNSLRIPPVIWQSFLASNWRISAMVCSALPHHCRLLLRFISLFVSAHSWYLTPSTGNQSICSSCSGGYFRGKVRRKDWRMGSRLYSEFTQ